MPSRPRPLAGQVLSYDAPSTEEIARRTGLPVAEIIRFDGNTSPHLLLSTRAEALTEELARIHTYPHGGYPRLERAIADEAGARVGEPLWADSLGPEGSSGDTYLKSLAADANAIARGLGGAPCELPAPR